MKISNKFKTAAIIASASAVFLVPAVASAHFFVGSKTKPVVQKQEHKAAENKQQPTNAEQKPAEAPVVEVKPAADKVEVTNKPKPVTTANKPKPVDNAKQKAESKPSYETVSVGLAVVGGSINASIGSAKPGTCYFEFKQYDGNGNKINYSSASSAANGGICSVQMPAGTWTKVYMTYKASDYSAKGYSYLMI